MQGLQQRPPIVVASAWDCRSEGHGDWSLLRRPFASKGLAVLLFELQETLEAQRGSHEIGCPPKRHFAGLGCLLWTMSGCDIPVLLHPKLCIVSLSALPPLAINTGRGPCFGLLPGSLLGCNMCLRLLLCLCRHSWTFCNLPYVYASNHA